MKLAQRPKYLLLSIATAGLVGLPVIAYLFTYALTVAFPFDQQGTFGRGFIALAVILVLLITPYCMLKLVSYIAHQLNSREKELRLRDIPKDGRPASR